MTIFFRLKLILIMGLCVLGDVLHTKESVSNKQSKREIVDRIIAFVDGTRILQSDLDAPRIAKDGGKYKLNELAFEVAMIKKATDRHVLPAEADVERQIVAFKIQNNIADISDVDFENYLKPYGFTTKMYKEQLASLLAVENFKRMEIADKIVVTSQEVNKYFEEHPVYSPEEYQLRMIPVKSKTTNDSIDLGWIKREELDEKFHFVFKMEKGQTSENPVKMNNKEYRVEILDKKERKKFTLTEQYGEIERLLTKEKTANELKGFEEKLMAETSVEIIDSIK